MYSYITGAKGFVGSHLLPMVKGEIVPIPHKLIRETNLDACEYFFFCSSYGNLVTQTDEFATYTANVIELIHVLKTLPSFKCFVFLSTSSVMLKQQTVYSRAKKAAEEILLAHMERHDVPVCIIRPFSIIGVGEQKTHLLPVLIDAAKTGREIELDPDATHDFIDVTDVVQGILSLATHKARGIYQLGTGNKTTNLELLRLVESVTKKKIAYREHPSLRPYDTDNWVSTNFKARSFGWLPRRTLEQTVKEMYDAH